MNRTFWNELGLFSVLAAVLFFLGGAVLVPSASWGQEDIKASLFKEADEALKVAQEKQANLYAPKAFLQGMERYRKAEEDLRKGKNLEDIRKKLKEAEVHFKKAAEATEVAAVIFAAAATARDDALSAQVTKYALESWNEAERKLEEAARTLEGGDAKGAKSKGGEAETLYRMAELEAIKANYLQGAWSALRRAEEMDVKDRAPETLEKASDLAQKAEALLTQNRYHIDEARQLAQQAEYEAVHAIYVSETIKRLKAADRTYEDVLLSAEEPLQKIAGVLDITARFHEGLDSPTEDILEAIEELQAEHSSCAQARREMEQRLLRLGSMEEELREEVQWQRIRREKMDRISASFSPEEGDILLDGENVIIRLYGLTFPIGKSTIEPQYFSLLTKLQRALAEFPDGHVIVEGHTDSQGSDMANQRLAAERAQAVRQYILANTDIPSARIEAMGYGESRPIASNETPEGRAKNRRIDIVIQPAEK